MFEKKAEDTLTSRNTPEKDRKKLGTVL